MLYGIDISNHQKGLQLSTSAADLYVMKATEGTNYVDKYCDPWVQWCITNGVPWGFYHFMRPNGGVAEAEFFYRNTRDYFTHGVPILDFEDTRLSTADAESFVWRIHELSGVWPLVYASYDFINNRGYFANSWVKSKCGLWLAGYPSRRTGWPSDATCPYPHAGWTLAMWQFTNCLSYDGTSVDGDVFYGDEEAWGKYAMGDNQTATSTPEPSAPSGDKWHLARQVLNGVFGNGSDREQALGSRYQEVQDCVNALVCESDYQLATRAIAGELGNGDDRKYVLGGRYNAVQLQVNKML